MKRILVPTDFSKCSEKASVAAMKLSENTEVDLHFLHITDIPIDWNTLENSEKIYPEVTEKVKRLHGQLDRLVEKARKSGKLAHKYLAFNSDYREILNHISKHKIDMVVMGSRGATGSKEWLVGSNTQKIVRLSPVPVLVVKEDQSETFKIDHLVFVSDFDEDVIDQFMEYVEFVQLFDAKLSLLFINTPENFTDTLTTKIKMGNYAMHAPGTVENTYIFNHYNFFRGLKAFCEEYQTDALGMITHGHHSGMHLFNSSLTEKVVNHVQLPVLTMHFAN